MAPGPAAAGYRHLMRWRIDSGPTEVEPHETEGRRWAWVLVPADAGGREKCTTYFSITESALVSDDLPARVREARETKGRSEVERRLGWDIPPRFEANATKISTIGGKPPEGK